jgi:DNA-binding beta-propeller fold protein YncE
VTDREAHEVIALHPAAGGQILFRAGRKPGSQFESFCRPTGIVCDSVNRRLVICDKDHNRIVFMTLDGYFISAFGRKGHENGEFEYPWDVDVSPSGDLIAVSDSRNHRIQMFDRFGNYLRKFSVYETKPFDYKLEFDYPRGITFDSEGEA